MRKAENNYYDELLCQSKSNVKKTWGTINAIIKRNNQLVAPQTVFNYDSKIYKKSKSIANGFNIFFVNVGLKPAENIKKINGLILDTINEPSKKLFFLEPVTENEVLKVVNSSANKTSMDHSGINFALVKDCIPFLVIPISHIAIISFEMGFFPDRMKIAKVIPIFKSGLKDYFINYRPVHLLLQFSKILEKNFLIIG